jgi:predicted amidohydrolase
MKICVAQTRPVKGDVDANIRNHKSLIALAASNNAQMIVFPELSLTGYEPTLAASLATNSDDPRFTAFQQLSDQHNLVIGFGMPIKNSSGITISMIIVQPQQSQLLYSKRYLHADEEPFFVSGENFSSFIVDDVHIALAICYEISVAEHPKAAAESKATVYLSSVAKVKRGMDKAITNLTATSKEYGMLTLMSNCIGPCDGEEGAGGSVVINEKGEIIDQLDDMREGILVLDTLTKNVVKKYV